MADDSPTHTFIAALEDCRRLSGRPSIWIHGQVATRSRTVALHRHSVCDGTQSVDVKFNPTFKLDPSLYHAIQLSLEGTDGFTAIDVERVEDHAVLYDAYNKCLDCLVWLTAQQEREDRARTTGFSNEPRVGGLDEKIVLDAIGVFHDPNIMTLAVYLGIASIGDELDPTLSRLVRQGVLTWDEESCRFTRN